MPKVSQEYKESKKLFILQCMSEVFEEKPLYQITMRDVIKKTGYSHGAIYRYYANLDEIYVDWLNHLLDRNAPGISLVKRVEDHISSNRKEEAIISGCIIDIGNYLIELLNTLGGKVCFELAVTYAYDFGRRESVLPNLYFKQSIKYAQDRVSLYLSEKIQEGMITPLIPVESIFAFAGASMDGIINHASISGIGDNDQDLKITTNIPELFRALSMAILSFLEFNGGK